ncbi:DNA polymerase III subunit delta [Anaerotignum lactatifermentans]|uniref:DNA polymerase III subunit delta n=1 Tax=Anaerotignum lactatifermentans TaxID=160404 RepID=A0ABS2G9W0_9FIRM|nr:DNA polymerase III subunit delta [Anaerotignum lactatifermentans]MBM6828533.1 DNA polymerase III subunit delta [Anaerotignum lactatifermentans]MBM6877940.1 DNA polymerase III subunit delta [Anaerotignum lactatifermentans]MBM6950115.1 DNA polymerase III subunit delta [Anaerotignum lactatifermentans]
MKELKKQWKQGEFHRCYLFYGSETYLIKNYEETLTKALLPPGAEGMNFDILEGRRATAAAIMDAAETLPFLNDKRLVLVRNSEFFQKGSRKEEGEALLDFLSDLPESTCLLFVEEKAEKNNRLYKAVAKHGIAVDFKPLTEKEIVSWLKKSCKDQGLSLADSTAVYLLRITDNSMENLVREIGKLTAYKGESGEITKEDVDAVCSISLEARIFDLVRAVAEGRTEQTTTLYRNLLRMKESPFLVLSLVTRQFRLILETALLSLQGEPNSEIASKLEIREFAVRDYLKQSKSFSKEQLQEALRDCLQTDLEIKGGRMEEELAVELLLLRWSSRQK